MIQLTNVNKIYPVGENNFFALRDVSLKIDKGEFVAIQGASGSGKTTLLNILGCIDTITSGSYTLDGQAVSSMSDRELSRLRNRHLGFVLQDFALINTQTVQYNVMLPLLFSDVPYKQVQERVAQALEIVGLADQKGKKANQLSGGQRQRVAIARALVTQPQILLADEPTGQLDSQTGRQIMELLARLNSQGITIIMVTHDQVLAQYASRQIFISDGQVVSQ